jgi:hypothetical protein
VSRLVRDTLSCSKKLAHHLGAMQYCICHYHRTKAAAFPVEHSPAGFSAGLRDMTPHRGESMALRPILQRATGVSPHAFTLSVVCEPGLVACTG